MNNEISEPFIHNAENPLCPLKMTSINGYVQRCVIYDQRVGLSVHNDTECTHLSEI